jgi:hypothetical protein
MTKINHRYFDVDCDMSNIVIKDSHKHFDMEYDMKVKYRFQFFIFCL